MKRFSRISLILGLTALLGGCANGWPRPLGLFNRSGETAADIEVLPDSPAQDASLAEGVPEAVTAPAEAEAASVAPGVLGFTVASLGDPTDPGLWLETPLVSSEIAGRIITDTAQTAFVTLRPSGGAVGSGSRISLAAMQALGLGLTDLATLTVVAGQ
jgi:hypothetical protein